MMKPLKIALAVLCALTPFQGHTQTPPSPPKRMALLTGFFSELPTRFPAEDLSSFGRFVSENVKVYEGNELVHASRQSWFDALRPRANGQAGYTISRSAYYLLSDGGIQVTEFTYPVTPEGSGAIYHPGNPFRTATYYFDDNRLIRVIYGKPMTPFSGLCQAARSVTAAHDQSVAKCD